MKLKAVSKINLGLNIKPQKKGAKKHEIYSLMARYNDLYDEIDIEVSDQKTQVIYYQQHQLLVLNNCVVTKALAYLNQKFSLKHNYHITIQKQIPIGSGLGGGSSDAASVMLFVCQNENISPKALDWTEIALEVGSDIPFFLSQYPSAIVAHYGDQNSPVTLPTNLQIKLYLSNQMVSTTIMFKEFDILNKNVDNINNYQLFMQSIRTKQPVNLNNDLQPLCLKMCPVVSQVFETVAKVHDYVTLSGSGPTIIGLNYKKG